jgi:hypothetical protein
MHTPAWFLLNNIQQVGLGAGLVSNARNNLPQKPVQELARLFKHLAGSGYYRHESRQAWQ